MAPSRGSTFTTTVGVINRVHCNTPNLRTPTEPTGAACLTKRNIFMIKVANLTNSRNAVKKNHANFTRRKFHLRILAFLRHQLRKGPRAPCQLPTFSNLQFNVMNDGTKWYSTKRQRISRLNIGTRTGDYDITDLQI
ncbi:hypothetical protein GPICK_03345 [Geobacter pickeringii]|uniref:Uncharacterized protein n=1 Tax=Geobacter pickeringii TaxID=345632 RepID=A0A0B5BEP9_9BACT|nr:hypothetical protein GPICK_03345 [Geobacter pickeringii]